MAFSPKIKPLRFTKQSTLVWLFLITCVLHWLTGCCVAQNSDTFGSLFDETSVTDVFTSASDFLPVSSVVNESLNMFTTDPEPTTSIDLYLSNPSFPSVVPVSSVEDLSIVRTLSLPPASNSDQFFIFTATMPVSSSSGHDVTRLLFTPIPTISTSIVASEFDVTLHLTGTQAFSSLFDDDIASFSTVSPIASELVSFALFTSQENIVYTPQPSSLSSTIIVFESSLLSTSQDLDVPLTPSAFLPTIVSTAVSLIDSQETPLLSLVTDTNSVYPISSDALLNPSAIPSTTVSATSSLHIIIDVYPTPIVQKTSISSDVSSSTTSTVIDSQATFLSSLVTDTSSIYPISSDVLLNPSAIPSTIVSTSLPLIIDVYPTPIVRNTSISSDVSSSTTSTAVSLIDSQVTFLSSLVTDTSGIYPTPAISSDTPLSTSSFVSSLTIISAVASSMGSQTTVLSSPVIDASAINPTPTFTSSFFRITTVSSNILSSIVRPSILITEMPSLTTSAMVTSPLATPVSTTPDVMVTVINATAVLVVWSPIADATGYVIFIIEHRTTSIQRRQVRSTIRVQADVTSYVISDLRPNTAYSIQVASIDQNNVTRDPSVLSNIITNEDVPGPPINVTWIDIGNGLLNVSWLPPVDPNGAITSYVVTIISLIDGSQYQYNVSGTLKFRIVDKPATEEFYIAVAAINSAGTGTFQNATMITSVGETPSSSGLSGGAVAAIVVIILLFLVLLIVGVVLLLLFVWKRWTNQGGIDVNIGEMEYKTSSSQPQEVYVSRDESDDSQLTAKRWMRANANYSTPSVLLPSIADLVSRYSTAEDVVGSKTIIRSQANGLSTVQEEQLKEQPESNNSSSERSREAPSTLSSVCSKTRLEVNKVVPAFNPNQLSEREKGMRESEIVDGNHPLFEMMENVYLPTVADITSLQQYHLEPSLLDMNEQIGQGEHCKVYLGTAEMLPMERMEDVVAVKVLKDDTFQDDFLGAAHILSQFSHKNIISLLAVTIAPPMMLVPYMELADLKKFLVRVRRRTRLEHQPCGFRVNDQLNISLQIASGMQYLSSKFYIHRALQSKYILLDEDFNVKITGFQFSLMLGDPVKYQELKEADKLPAKWFALETLTDRRFTPYTDIWSYGVVLWEIFSYGLTPYRGLQNIDVLTHLRNGERLNKPSDCPEDIYTLMLHCWNEKCRERPSFADLSKHLTGITEANRHHQDDMSSGFNIFEFPGISLTTDPQPSEANGSCVSEAGPAMNDSTVQLIESNTELEMTEVVLQNEQADDSSASASLTNVIDEEQNRHSNRSSIPELVLSTQSRENVVSEIDLSTTQLMSTEEYTVL